MSNKASDQLHRLIHSMSKHEKRYFKVAMNRQAEPEHSNHILLFDAIEQQEVYDEGKLMKKFAGRALTNRFSIAKNRLYNAVLRSLDAYHLTGDEEAQLHRQIHAARILFEKSLYDQSTKILDSARKVALRLELPHVLSAISKLEKRILEHNQYEGIETQEELDELRENDRNNTDVLAATNELWAIKSRLFRVLYRQGKVRSEEELAHFRTLINSQLEQFALAHPESTEVNYLVYHIRSAYAFGTGDYVSCFEHLKDNLKLIRNRPDYFRQDPAIVLAVLTNAIYVGMRLREWKESFRLMDDLRALRDSADEIRSEDYRMRLFAAATGTELALYAQSGEFDQGIELADEVKLGLQRYGDALSSIRQAHLKFNLAVCFTGTGRFQEAQRWLHSLLNETPIDHTRDLHCMAQLLSLIVQLELGETRLLPYSLRSARRFLSTRRKTYRTEEIVLEFIGDSLRKRQSDASEERLSRFCVALEELRNDPFERNAFEFFDFYAWALGKATGKPFKDMIAA